MWIKVCGVTRVEDALALADAGVDALGLNFIPSSRRRVAEPEARRIVEAVGDRVEAVGVVADLSAPELRRLAQAVGLHWLQLHGSEPASLLSALGERAYKAVRIGSAADVELAATYPGERLLVDAKVDGTLGGAGVTFDWELVATLVASRPVILAGGLGPGNVAAAVARLHPWGIDVASGVEVQGHPGRQDLDKVKALVAATRG